ncbi:hypothetical protein F4810DRAFT_721026 [Camillea tinctor]|nr:hypothetical protein F4810DRAFT_721026 [Camillea tinctor]
MEGNNSNPFGVRCDLTIPNLDDLVGLQIITLDVGGREFKASRKTLVGESLYFQGRLINFAASIFIDRNPQLFEHILEFLRTQTPPLFFDTTTLTFDYVKYAALLGEARFFGVHKLESWISSKEYLQAVKIQKSISVVSDLSPELLSSLSDHNTRVDISTGWGIKKVPVCPTAKPSHHGKPEKCGDQCRKMRYRQGGVMMFDDEAVPTGVIIKTKVEIGSTILMGDDYTSDTTSEP